MAVKISVVMVGGFCIHERLVVLGLEFELSHLPVHWTMHFWQAERTFRASSLGRDSTSAA